MAPEEQETLLEEQEGAPAEQPAPSTPSGEPEAPVTPPAEEPAPAPAPDVGDATAATPPAPGWWVASDGNWYPPAPGDTPSGTDAATPTPTPTIGRH